MAGIARRGRRLTWPRLVLATLGGADTKILAKAGVDITEMTGRGIAALIPALFGGLAALISFRYAYALPFAAAAAAGTGWAVIVLCFDLSLMAAAPDRRGLSRVITFGSRAMVSVLAAFTFAGAIVMFMYSKDIATQVAVDQQTDLAAYNKDVITPAYAGRINADQATIRAAQRQIAGANQATANSAQKVARARVQATCESQGVSGLAGCGRGTGLIGYGRVYRVRLSELKNDEAALASGRTQAAATSRRLDPQIRSAQADLSQAKRQRNADYAEAQRRYSHNDGLIARWRALGELESRSTNIRVQVWLLEGLIVAIDLAAVIAKLTSKTPSYNRALAAARKKVALRAGASEEKAADAIEMRRADREARSDLHDAFLDAQLRVSHAALAAWVRVSEWRISQWVGEQTGGQETGTAEFSDAWQPPPRRRATDRHPAGQAAPIHGKSLGDLLPVVRGHSKVPVLMAPLLRRVAWIGVGLQAALGVALLLTHLTRAAVAGGWLIVPALAGTLALAAYSRGFRRGPSWAHFAALNTALLGLVLPIAIVLVNI